METTIKPSSKEICQLFMQYWGHPFKFISDKETTGNISACVNFRGWNVISEINREHQKYFAIKSCSILVKPLDKISQEDAIKLGSLFQNLMRNDYLTALELGMRIATKYFSTDLSNRAVYDFPFAVRIIDAIRSMGYAAPYGEWSVEQLVEFGIYKLID